MRPYVDSAGEGGGCEETNLKIDETFTHSSCDHSANSISWRVGYYDTNS